jgi:hypothetical protein
MVQANKVGPHLPPCALLLVFELVVGCVVRAGAAAVSSGSRQASCRRPYGIANAPGRADTFSKEHVLHAMV